jgi:uncharacterized membrane protein YtjA (UPF0391 family)
MPMSAQRLRRKAHSGAGLSLIAMGDERRGVVLYWALVFLVVSLVAALFGFGGIAATAAGIAQILFYIFIVLFLATLITGLLISRRGP